jgi:hypothetical protein
LELQGQAEAAVRGRLYAEPLAPLVVLDRLRASLYGLELRAAAPALVVAARVVQLQEVARGRQEAAAVARLLEGMLHLEAGAASAFIG